MCIVWNIVRWFFEINFLEVEIVYCIGGVVVVEKDMKWWIVVGKEKCCVDKFVVKFINFVVGSVWEVEIWCIMNLGELLYNVWLWMRVFN